jgi:predicted TIM-barrel fold metal-dependent hydrolase
MTKWNRREWLAFVAAIGACRQLPDEPASDGLSLEDFEPASMLRVPESIVERAMFPVIDFHAHVTWSAVPLGADGGEAFGERVDFLGEPERLLTVMDQKNVELMVNLTGGVGDGLEQTLERFDRAHPGRFLSFTEPSWNAIERNDFPRFQAEQLEKAHELGARGLKLTKTLGLYLRENVTTGALVPVDDPRFDPMWETAGSLGLPVAIHVSDPDAFFLPTNRHNERYEELTNHPDWSFYGKDFPTKESLLEARNRVFERHPNTQFVALHVGNRSEDLDDASSCLDRYPNMSVEIGARIGELGRQPRRARRFFESYQDRILFGTDAIPPPLGNETPQQIFSDELYQIYFRFLETEDEYFDYAPAPVPPQGRWRIHGLGLSESILEKVYRDNAARILGLV